MTDRPAGLDSLLDWVTERIECDRCNYDTHCCPGCGEPLQHGVEVCAQCAAELAAGER